MNNSMFRHLGVYGGLYSILCFGTGFLLSNWMPPFSPTLSALELAALYQDNHQLLLLGAVLMMLSTFFIIPCFAVVVLLIRRVENGWGIPSMIVLISSSAAVINICLSGIFWAVAAFRPDRNPDVTQVLYDLGFLFFFGAIPLFLLIFAIIAYAALSIGEDDEAIFPRWFGYLNILLVIVLIPGVFTFFFKTGPLAWDGLITFWIALPPFTATFFAFSFGLKNGVKILYAK